jgi:hypothetical protein
MANGWEEEEERVGGRKGKEIGGGKEEGGSSLVLQCCCCTYTTTTDWHNFLMSDWLTSTGYNSYCCTFGSNLSEFYSGLFYFFGVFFSLFSLLVPLCRQASPFGLYPPP